MGKIKDNSTKLATKSKGFISDFKKFAMRGNVIDMAVAVVMGTAFNKIISSLVNDVVMPAIGALMGGINFTDLKYVISPAVVENNEEIVEAAIKYGMFIQSVVDFLIIAFSMFIVIKLVALMSRKKEQAEEEAPPPPKPDDVVLLEEIRDLLKEKNDK